LRGSEADEAIQKTWIYLYGARELRKNITAAPLTAAREDAGGDEESRVMRRAGPRAKLLVGEGWAEEGGRSVISLLLPVPFTKAHPPPD